MVIGDGFAGEPSRAPYDRIIVTAAAAEVPQALTEQLAEDGIMVAPLGPPDGHQELARLTKTNGWLKRDNLIAVRFVPLLPGKARELSRSSALRGTWARARRSAKWCAAARDPGFFPSDG